MKTRIYLLISILALLGSIFAITESRAAREGKTTEGNVVIISSPELFEITSTWVEEFQRNNPAFQFSVKEAEITSLQYLSEESLVFMTEDEVKGHGDIWKMNVAREVIVPVLNASNPAIEELYATGASQAALALLFTEPGQRYWDKLVKGAKADAISIYVCNDATVKDGIGKYLGTTIPENMLLDEQQLISEIENNPNAIGFCKLSSVLNSDEGHLAPHLRFLPIDKNGNGKLDYIEDIYADPLTLTRGVWIGKYPKDLSRDYYVVAATQPEEAGRLAFLEWVLTTGQEYAAHAGLSSLAAGEAQARLDHLIVTEEVMPPQAEAYSPLKIVLFIAMATLVLSIMIGAIAGFRRKAAEARKMESIQGSARPLGFDEKTVSVPKGILYDRTHTWAFMEQDGTVKIGIDDFLQHVTGTITRVEMKHTGEKVKKGEHLATLVQKGKQLHLYAPVSGTIQQSNPDLVENPWLINDSPYADGWLYRIEPSNWMKETALLNMAGKYMKWLGDEMIRLKDFLAFPSQPQQLQYLQILQDGGLLKDHILEDMGPQVWEEFQSQFLDKNR